jgi:hypothetical protein
LQKNVDSASQAVRVEGIVGTVSAKQSRSPQKSASPTKIRVSMNPQASVEPQKIPSKPEGKKVSGHPAKARQGRPSERQQFRDQIATATVERKISQRLIQKEAFKSSSEQISSRVSFTLFRIT